LTGYPRDCSWVSVWYSVSESEIVEAFRAQLAQQLHRQGAGQRHVVRLVEEDRLVVAGQRRYGLQCRLCTVIVAEWRGAVVRECRLLDRETAGRVGVVADEGLVPAQVLAEDDMECRIVIACIGVAHHLVLGQQSLLPVRVDHDVFGLTRGLDLARLPLRRRLRQGLVRQAGQQQACRQRDRDA
jgi:hypothetical protein